MSSALDLRRHLNAASNKNSALYKILDELCKRMEAVGTKIGGIPGFTDTPSSVTTNVAPPATVGIDVSGIDGKFLITLTNPQTVNPQSPTIASLRWVNGVNPGRFPIVHNLQSATDLNFNNASNLVDYGISGQLGYEIQDPNVTRFFRVRSSYDGQNWNNWTVYSSAATCGPVGVWSGLLRTPSLALVNSAAQTTDGTNALTQHGTSSQIDVAGKTWNVGPQKITYLGGSVDPGVFGKFYVYAIDTHKAGGAVTYLTTQNIGDLSSQDGIIIFGSITTSSGGGGTGGGGGSCHVQGTMIEMYDGSQKDCSAILKGDVLKGIDGGPEVAQADAEPVPNQPCFTLAFANGVSLDHGVSSTEPIMLAFGTFQNVFDSMVGIEYVTKLGNSKMTAKTFKGMCLVWRQRLDRTKTFWADGLGSHNMKTL